MLDTNIVSDLVRNSLGPLVRHIVRVGSEAVGVSMITAAELRYGCARKGYAKLLASIDAILGSVQVLAFDIPADTAYYGIRAELEAAGKLIGPNDLLIAAHASSVETILITANTGAFSPVRGLQVENSVSPL